MVERIWMSHSTPSRTPPGGRIKMSEEVPELRLTVTITNPFSRCSGEWASPDGEEDPGFPGLKGSGSICRCYTVSCPLRGGGSVCKGMYAHACEHMAYMCLEAPFLGPPVSVIRCPTLGGVSAWYQNPQSSLYL